MITHKSNTQIQRLNIVRFKAQTYNWSERLLAVSNCSIEDFLWNQALLTHFSPH